MYGTCCCSCYLWSRGRKTFEFVFFLDGEDGWKISSGDELKFLIQVGSDLCLKRVLVCVFLEVVCGGWV